MDYKKKYMKYKYKCKNYLDKLQKGGKDITPTPTPTSTSTSTSTSTYTYTNLKEVDYIVPVWDFNDGTKLSNFAFHYTTLGNPRHDATGNINNAILFLHATGSSAQNMLTPGFMEHMYGPGKPLDAGVYYIILPDSVGNGKSTKPTHRRDDGGAFPRYNYSDMVKLQHSLLVQKLRITHVRLVMGISMGGMHTWMWGIMYPDFMDGLMPIVCLPQKITGRNLLWHRMLIRGVAGGTLMNMMLNGVPQLGRELGSVEACDKYITDAESKFKVTDDMKYVLDASRDYAPEGQLELIKARVFALNFSDDELNPPSLHTLERLMPKVKNGSYLIQQNDTNGHGTATSRPDLWADKLGVFLQTLTSTFVL